MFLDRFLLRLIHYVLSLISYVYQWWVRVFQIPCVGGGGGLLSWFYYFFQHHLKRKAVVPRLSCIRADAKQLKKLPLHVGLTVNENEFSYSDICNIVIWSMAMGITYISVYDIHGDLKRNSALLHSTLLKKKQELLGPEENAYEIFINSGSYPPEVQKSTKQIIVNVLSLEDGRQSLVHIAQHLCEQVLQRQHKVEDIDHALIDKCYQGKYGCPDPDLLIRFGKTESLLGFSPWQAQFSEILSLPSHVDLDYKMYLGTLLKYANSLQRSGK